LPAPSTRHRAASLKRLYGLTASQYEQMATRQNHVCAICGAPCATGNRLSVDHNHQTNTVRGLLCQRHNKGLGFFDVDRVGPDLLKAAVRYMTGYQGVPF
jgi:hypothetical protein